jgi:hypothetical protein
MAQSLIGTGASLMFDMLGKEAAAQAALRPRPFHISNFTSRHIGTGPAFSGGLPRLGLFHRMAVIRPPDKSRSSFLPGYARNSTGVRHRGKMLLAINGRF